MTSHQIRRINRQSPGETPLVSGILQRAAVRSIADEEQVQPGTLRESRFRHDFSQVPIHSGSLPNIQTDRYEQEADRVAKNGVEQIHASAVAHSTQQQSQATEPAAPVQPKLTIGQPNDQYEHEADRVAEQVMSMAPPATPNIQRQTEKEQEEIQTKPLVETITPVVQFQKALEEDEPIQAKCESCEQEEQLQRSPNEVPQVQADLENRLNASKGGGSPLPDEVRSFMEPRFKADFSQVRVHTDREAVQMNRELGAQAFTHSHHIYYGAGKAPTKDELTGHELTHVVQQTRSFVPEVQRTEEQRYTGGLRWYIEADPPTPIVLQGTNVTFRIRNNPGLTEERQQELASQARRGSPYIRSLEEEIPAVDLTDVEWGIIDDSGRSFPWTPGFWNSETVFEHSFNHEGRRTIYFRGTPSSTEPIPHREIYVSYDIEVAHHPHAAVLERTEALEEQDESAIRDSETRYGELANLFQRIAIRRALNTLSENKREAINLSRQYEQPNALEYNPRGVMAHRLRPVHRRLLEARSATIRQQESVPRFFRGVGVGGEPIDNPNYERDVARYQQLIDNIQHRIDHIEATYPELAAFYRYQETHPTGGGLDFRQTTVAALSNVARDIDRTRNRIITEDDISILDVTSVVNPLLREFDSSNPNIRVAVEMVRSQRDSVDLWTELGLAGVSIALLFVPGIGPFLSAGFGLVTGTVQAISSWEEAEAFTTAANAGVREGVVTTAEAEERRTSAMWQSIFALGDAADFGLETSQLISSVTRVAQAARRGVGIADEFADAGRIARDATEGSGEVTADAARRVDSPHSTTPHRTERTAPDAAETTPDTGTREAASDSDTRARSTLPAGEGLDRTASPVVEMTNALGELHELRIVAFGVCRASDECTSLLRNIRIRSAHCRRRLPAGDELRTQMRVMTDEAQSLQREAIASLGMHDEATRQVTQLEILQRARELEMEMSEIERRLDIVDDVTDPARLSAETAEQQVDELLAPPHMRESRFGRAGEEDELRMPTRPGFDRHHIISMEELQNPDLRSMFEFLERQFGWHINSPMNGIYLPRRPTVTSAGTRSVHRGAHPRYTSMIEGRLMQIHQRWRLGHISDEELILEVRQLQREYRGRLRRGEIILNRADPRHP